MIDAEHSEPHSYFIPMVDMLAGVVFILVILLASVTLVSREDFASAETAQREITAIEAELAKARALERDVLEPRRNAEAALRLLLRRIQDSLSARGVPAEIDEAGNRLVLADPAAFEASGVALTAKGSTAAEAIADALSGELGCLAQGGGERGSRCADYPPARLDRVAIGVEGGPQAPRADARALGLLSAVIARAPALLSLRAVDGEALIIYRGASAEAAAEEPAAPADAAGRIVLAFQMDLPPLPPQ